MDEAVAEETREALAEDRIGDALDELLEERGDLRSAILGWRKRQPHRQRVVGVEPRIDRLHSEETVDEQPALNEKQQRDGHFGAYECALETMPARVSGRQCAFRFECFLNVGDRSLKCGGQTEDEARENIREAIELYVQPDAVEVGPDAITREIIV